MSILPPKHSAVRVRLTQADRDVLVARARRKGVPLSEIIRQMLTYCMNLPEKPERQASQTQPNGVHMTQADKGLSRYIGPSDGRGGA